MVHGRTHPLLPLPRLHIDRPQQVAALTGYDNVNSRSLKLWEEVYSPETAPFISLTDTFTTTAFIKVRPSALLTVPRILLLANQDMLADPETLFRWHGVRQDSGDPFSYAERICDVIVRSLACLARLFEVRLSLHL